MGRRIKKAVFKFRPFSKKQKKDTYLVAAQFTRT